MSEQTRKKKEQQLRRLYDMEEDPFWQKAVGMLWHHQREAVAKLEKELIDDKKFDLV